MKKIFLALAFAMLICTFSFSAFASDDATAVISSATVKAGDEVTLTVSIQNSPGIAGAQFYIGYDSDVMTYISAAATNSDFYASSSEAEGTNPIKVIMANFSMNNIEGEINIAELKFKVSDSAKSGEYDVSISSVDAYDSVIAAVPIPNIVNGVVTVKSSDCAETTAPTDSKFIKLREYTNNFEDVTEDKWFEKYVKIAYEYALVNGTSATKFSPDNKFTVAQAITAAANIHTTYNGTAVRVVAEGESWYAPYVEYCVENGVITDGQFTDFDANITRGDMAIVFANILPECEYEAVRSVLPSDVVEESDVFPAYKLLYEAGIVNGDAGTGNYRPDDEIVRSEACVIFTRLAAVEQRAK